MLDDTRPTNLPLSALAEPASGNSGANPTNLALSAMAEVIGPVDSGPNTVSGEGQGSLDGTGPHTVATDTCQAACVGGVECDTSECMIGEDRLAVAGAVTATATSRAQSMTPATTNTVDDMSNKCSNTVAMPAGFQLPSRPLVKV